MTPFAGMGVNIAVEDALKPSNALVDAAEVAEPVKGYGFKMWKGAHEEAERNLMYQGLIFGP